MDHSTNDEPGTPPVRAAQYIRMSTEHQQYSTANQEDVVRDYADRRGFEIVQTYADAGKSGLRVEGRESLKRLILDVESGQADFTVILVYDVSRWGRFQDADESAYYEYLCKRAGIDVHYCAEQFENDGRPTSTIIKSVKRAMAGEYSRELSTKVFQGQCRLIELGYRQGGAAGYGLRRMLIDHTGQPKSTLKHGEYKSIQTDRVILVPGPTEEVQTVFWMYRMFTQRGYTFSEIAAKTDLAKSYVQGIVKLLKKGEERLVQAVEAGQIPITIAMTISRSDDKAIQKALADAYESNDLRGKQLLAARRLIETRRLNGKSSHTQAPSVEKKVSTDDLLRTYQQETLRQRMVIQRAKICETRLLFATSALKQLLGDDNFVNVLRAESLDTLPQYLATQIGEERERE